MWLAVVEDVSATDVTLKKLDKRPVAGGRQAPQLGAGDVSFSLPSTACLATAKLPDNVACWQSMTFRNSGEPGFHDPHDMSYAAKYDETFPDEVSPAELSREHCDALSHSGGCFCLSGHP